MRNPSDRVLHEKIPNPRFYRTYQTYECHMNPLSYFSPVIDTISMMIIKFQLDYNEAISLLRAFPAMPMTVFLFRKDIDHDLL